MMIARVLLLFVYALLTGVLVLTLVYIDIESWQTCRAANIDLATCFEQAQRES